MATVVTSSSEQQRCNNKNVNSTLDDIHQANPLVTSTSSSVVYDVEHLATFSTTGSHDITNSNNRLVPNDSDGASKCFTSINNHGTTSSASSTTSARSATTANVRGSTQISTTTPKVALQRLFELEKQSGIWTQRMQIELQDEYMLIVDCETNSVVERFERECVIKPEAFNEYNDIYNNIVVFIIQQSNKISSPQKKHEEGAVPRESDIDLERTSLKIEEGELHIFQCVSHKAQQLVSDILSWKIQQSSDNMANLSTATTSSESRKDDPSSNQRDIKKISCKQPDQASKQAAISNQKSNSKNKISPTSNKSLAGGKPVVTVASSSNTSENVPIVNVNVKETVQVFNQIAALREKSKPTSPTNPRPLSDASAASSHSTQATNSNSSSSNVATNGLTEIGGPIKGPLSPNGHFYKQQSIRATLAPKYASGCSASDSLTIDGEPLSSSAPSKAVNQINSTSPNNNNNNSTSSNSSAASSSEPLAKSGSAYHSNSSHDNSHHQVSKHHSSGQCVDQQQQKLKHLNHHHQHHQQQLVNEVTSIQSSVFRAPQTSQHQHKHPDHQHSHHKSNKSLQSRGQQQRTSQQSDSSRSHTSSSQSQPDQVSTNESYVSVLNHCFDDIEKFITRLQQAVAGQTALRDIQSKRKSSKRSGKRTSSNEPTQSMPGLGNGPSMSASELAILSAKARGPSEDDYFEILSKFKLAFNLLAKLKGCIHEPNAPELVHFLFTPLVIIIESARNATPPVDPTLVGIPYLNQDALDLLSNCCTSKESDVWISLGPNWTQTIDANLLKASRLPSSFQPIFSDGWAPIIGELELIGLVASSTAVNHQHPIGVPVNPASLSSDCVATSAAAAIVDDGPTYRHRHHHHRGHGESRRGHVSSSYGLDELNTNSSITSAHPLDSGYSAGMMSNGRSVDGLNSNLSGRDYKKRNAPALTSSSHGRRLVVPDGMIEPGPQSYLNSMPYDYINDPNSVLDSQELLASGHRGLDNSLRNMRSFNQPVNGRQSRGTKTNPRHSEQMPIHPGLDLAHYPPISYHRQQQVAADEDGRPDMDLIAHHNASTLQSDDYNDLPENYLDDHHAPKNMPGPSNHYYKEDKSHRYPHHNLGHKNHYNRNHHSFPPYDSEYLSEPDHEAMLLDLGPAQTEWFFELQARGAMIVRVLFTREANNDKELSVRRGEILEVLDDSRKWWRTRNIDLQVAHVPHTIVAIMHGYKTLEELLIENPGEFDGKDPNIINSQQYARRELQSDNYNRDQWRSRENRRGSKNSGPFRYF